MSRFLSGDTLVRLGLNVFRSLALAMIFFIIITYPAAAPNSITKDTSPTVLGTYMITVRYISRIVCASAASVWKVISLM